MDTGSAKKQLVISIVLFVVGLGIGGFGLMTLLNPEDYSGTMYIGALVVGGFTALTNLFRAIYYIVLLYASGVAAGAYGEIDRLALENAIESTGDAEPSREAVLVNTMTLEAAAGIPRLITIEDYLRMLEGKTPTSEERDVLSALVPILKNLEKEADQALSKSFDPRADSEEWLFFGGEELEPGGAGATAESLLKKIAALLDQ